MKKTLLFWQSPHYGNRPIPVCAAVEKYIMSPIHLSYAHPEDEGRSGLKSHGADGDKWLSVSDGFTYLKCDWTLGRKRMTNLFWKSGRRTLVLSVAAHPQRKNMGTPFFRLVGSGLPNNMSMRRSLPAP